MKPAVARLYIERRFLAGLFLYPRVVDIERHHFLAAEHGILFECIREAYETFPWEPYRDNGYDDIALVIVLELVKARAHEVSKLMGRPDYNDHQVRKEYESYFHTYLLTQSVMSRGLDDLVEQMRECPRCGR